MVQTGDRLYPVLCHCPPRQDNPNTCKGHPRHLQGPNRDNSSIQDSDLAGIRLCLLCRALLSRTFYQGWPSRDEAPSRASRPASGLGQKGAPRRLGPDPDLVPRCAAVPAQRRQGRRCFVTCGFEHGQVFS